MFDMYVEPEENEANDGYIWNSRGRDLFFAALSVAIVFTGVVAAFLSSGAGNFIAAGTSTWGKQENSCPSI